jgi:GNAT superfamily N-acetyltransferase
MTSPAEAFSIQRLNIAQAEACLPALASLLIDAVEAGASVGFLPPLRAAEAQAYWQTVQESLRAGERLLWAAWAGGQLAGSVQLDLCPRPNGRHRAEVMKLLVHRNFRRRGLGRALMLTVEAAARERGRTTLVLDTLVGEPSELLYTSLGWVRAGVIPQFARTAAGALEATALYYKLL